MLNVGAAAGSFFGRWDPPGTPPIVDRAPYYYEAEIARNVAQAHWTHEYFGASSSPSETQFEAAIDDWHGVHNMADAETVINRTPRAATTMSWRYDAGDSWPTALVYPTARGHEADPVLVQPFRGAAAGANGTPTWSCDCREGAGYFSTAGISSSGGVDRHFSLTSFDDGSAIMMRTSPESQLLMPFEGDSKLWVGSNTRPVYTEAGSSSVADGATQGLTGSWANVADRYGLVVRTGFTPELTLAAGEAEANGYAHSAQLLLTGYANSGGATARTAALVLPDATARQTALTAQDTRLALISGGSSSSWTALFGRAVDGTARFAIANFSGSTQTVLMTGMDTALGAPIPDRDVDVDVDAGTTMSVTLASPASVGWKGYFYIRSAAQNPNLTVRPISPKRLKLTNAGASAGDVTVTYADGSGALVSGSANLAVGAVAYARAIDDYVAIARLDATASSFGHPASDAYDGSNATYWSSQGSLPQDLVVDYNKLVDMGGLRFDPVANNGPRDYTVAVSSSSSCLNGSTGYGSALGTVTSAARTGTQSVSFATAQRARCVRIRTTAAWAASVQIADLALIAPAVDIDFVDPQRDATGVATIDLAKGGTNFAKVRITNNTGSEQTVTLGASSLPTGVTATLPGATRVAAGGSTVVQVQLSSNGSTGPASGTNTIAIADTTAGTVVASENLVLAHSTNLALNTARTAFPAISSNGEYPDFLYPATLGNDGDAGTFWVSRRASFGSGDPVCLVVDLGANVTVGRATMNPLTNYGPRSFTIETSTTGGADCASTTGWTTKATVASATDGTTYNLSWTPGSARYVRLRVTATYSRGDTQVEELSLFPS